MTGPIPSSSRGGCLIRSLLIIAVLGLILVAVWIVLLPGIVVSTVQARTGFVVKVEQMSVNPFTGLVNIEGAVVENPIGWPSPEFITLRRFKVDAELFPFLSHRFVANEMIVDVEKLSLVRNGEGQLNTDAFRTRIAGAKDKAGPSQPSAASPKTEFLIRHLVLKFDRLVLADYSGKKPLIKEYDLKISREMRDVDSVAKLINPFVGVALDASGKLLDLAPSSLGDAVNTLQQAGKKTGESLKKFFQSLEKKKP
jgi:uncharacterized protein involved in outer membrane biogenesis